MKKPQKTIIIFTLLIMFGVANISACGQKGPLRLPSPTPPTTTIHVNL